MFDLFAGVVAFSILDWVLVAVALIALVGSITSYAHERFGVSFLGLLAIVGVAGFMNHTQLLDMFHQGSLVKTLVKPVVGYLIAGIIVSLVNWIFYVMHVKTRYRNLVLDTLNDSTKLEKFKETVIENQNNGSATPLDAALFTDDVIRKVLQLATVADNKLEIFGYSYDLSINFYLSSLKSFASIADIEAMVDKRMAEIFPPKTLKGRGILASAVFEWPITILSLLFSRLLTVLVDKLLFASRKFIDWVSHISFGSHEIKL